jgi:hypothetical protein
MPGTSQECAPDCRWRHRAGIQRYALHDQEGSTRVRAQLAELTPQATADKREIKVTHFLPLDRGVVFPYQVVPGGEDRGGDDCTELAQAHRNRLRLVHVDFDFKFADQPAVPTEPLRVCSYCSREARTM